MEVFILSMFTGILGFAVGYCMGVIRTHKLLSGHPELLDEDYILEEDDDEPTTNPGTKRMDTVMETADGQFFAYCARTSLFLAQGGSFSILCERLQARFPNTIFIVTPENMKTLGLLK